MNFWTTLLLGILIGWLIEWIIDWLYWRKKLNQEIERKDQELATAQERIAILEKENQTTEEKLSALERKHSAAQEKIDALEKQAKSDKKIFEDKLAAAELEKSSAKKDAQEKIDALEAELEKAAEVRIDPLEKIKGIGPVIKTKLYSGGILSFKQLGNLTPAELEAIVGDDIKRLADEDEIIRQAKELAEKN